MCNINWLRACLNFRLQCIFRRIFGLDASNFEGWQQPVAVEPACGTQAIADKFDNI